MAWAAVFIHGGVVTVARPPALDVLEAWFADPDTRDERYGQILEHARRDGFDWQGLAESIGVPREAINHFLEDWTNQDELILGCLEAVRWARTYRLPLRFVCRLGESRTVHFVYDDHVEAVIYAPEA